MKTIKLENKKVKNIKVNGFEEVGYFALILIALEFVPSRGLTIGEMSYFLELMEIIKQSANDNEKDVEINDKQIDYIISAVEKNKWGKADLQLVEMLEYLKSLK